MSLLSSLTNHSPPSPPPLWRKEKTQKVISCILSVKAAEILMTIKSNLKTVFNVNSFQNIKSVCLFCFWEHDRVMTKLFPPCIQLFQLMS